MCVWPCAVEPPRALRRPRTELRARAVGTVVRVIGQTVHVRWPEGGVMQYSPGEVALAGSETAPPDDTQPAVLFVHVVQGRGFRGGHLARGTYVVVEFEGSRCGRGAKPVGGRAPGWGQQCVFEVSRPRWARARLRGVCVCVFACACVCVDSYV